MVASGIPTGTGNNQVNLATLASGNYQIVAKSASGNNFTITKPATGNVTRTCTTTSRAPAPRPGELVSRPSGRMPREKPSRIKGLSGDCRSIRERPNASAFRGGWHQTIQTSPQKEETNAAEAE